MTKALVVTLFIYTFLVSGHILGQVGINTTSPSAGSIMDVNSTDKGIVIPRLNITDLSTIAPVTGGSTESLLAYNTNTTTGPGFFYWDGGEWVKVIDEKDDEPPIDSISLASDIQISASSWTSVPSMTLTFTARKSSVFVSLSASGFAFTNSMALVQMRIINTTTGTTLGGTNTNMQSYDDVTGTLTSWSCSFSKLLSGLTVGSTYNLNVEGQVAGILGTPNAAIFASSNADAHHLTLSVLQ